ncbi:MAG: helix-turn-helix domain-containing protein [Tannerellaceae bacterium]|nr:helix-turn-helix domain-containing protein [Tannerellaceae bacterium]
MRKLILSYTRFLNTHYAISDRADLSWLNSLVFCLACCYYTGVIDYFIRPVAVAKMQSEIVDFTYFLFVNIVGLKGIRRNSIFVTPILSEHPDPVESQEKFNIPEAGDTDEDISKGNSYLNYGLKKKDALALAERLKEYMDKEKPYINADLDLRDLAALLNVYPHYVTQVLNTLFNQNFYEFVNTYRVNEAKKHLEKSRRVNKISILSIAYDCGFNSKSSFNRIFKRKTGMTPSEFRNHHKEENED